VVLERDPDAAQRGLIEHRGAGDELGARDGVALGGGALLGGELLERVLDLARHLALADVVEQHRHPEVGELAAIERQHLADVDRHQRDVDRVGVGVVVVLGQAGEPHHHRLR